MKAIKQLPKNVEITNCPICNTYVFVEDSIIRRHSRRAETEWVVCSGSGRIVILEKDNEENQEGDEKAL